MRHSRITIFADSPSPKCDSILLLIPESQMLKYFCEVRHGPCAGMLGITGTAWLEIGPRNQAIRNRCIVRTAEVQTRGARSAAALLIIFRRFSDFFPTAVNIATVASTNGKLERVARCGQTD
jgi:hypothetical protein